jgi:MFS family permease
MARLQIPTALHYADYRRYTVARLLWALASQMLVVAVGYQVYMISKNPFDLGLIGLSQFLPFIVLTLPAGHIADTFDRRRVLIVCYGLLTVCAGALAVITITEPANVGPIIALMMLYGAARSLALPTAQALVPNLVPTADFPSAVAFSSTTYQTATIVGPALGGILLVIGPQVVYLAAVGFLAMATIFMTRLRHGGRSTNDGPRKAISVTTLLSGVQFVRSRPIILGSISLDMFAVLFGGAVALLPIYATDILHVGPTGLGLLRAAPAVGALAAAVTLGIVPLRRRAGPWLFGSVAAFGVATVAFAVSTTFLISIAALVAMGCADMISVYCRNLVVQLATPDEIRGRVSAVNGVFVGASNELGEFESGITAAWWGPVGASLVGGVITIGVAITWAVLFPMLRRMDRFPTLPATGEPLIAAEQELAERGP